MSNLKAFAVGDCDTYAAYDAQGALDAANDHVGGNEPVYVIDEVRELTDAELDHPWPEFDENEEVTGNQTSIRNWLSEASVPGYLCGEDW